VLYIAQYCDWFNDFHTIRTALFPRIDRHHCHPTTATLHLPIFTLAYLSQYCHSFNDSTTIRTALVSRIDWCHCHPTTATLSFVPATRADLAGTAAPGAPVPPPPSSGVVVLQAAVMEVFGWPMFSARFGEILLCHGGEKIADLES
jgi:hypothetical protein